MNALGNIYRAAARALAPRGELGWDDLLTVTLDDRLPPVSAPGQVELRLASEADVDAIIALYAEDPWLSLADYAADPADPAQVRELYLDRLRRGELCFLALHEGRIAHVNWCCWHWGDVLPGQPLRLRPGEVYTTDAITAPAYRGRGLHAFVLRAMLADARSRGARRAYTLTRIDRFATYKALSEVGYRSCGRLIYFLPKGSTRTHILWRSGFVEPLFRPAIPAGGSG